MKQLTRSLAAVLLAALVMPARTIGQTGAAPLWQKQEGNPVLVASPPVRFDETVSGASVLHDGTTYKMWYSGRSPTLGRGYRIGHAIYEWDDHEEEWRWRKVDGPLTAGGVLDRGDSWDRDAMHPSVLYDEQAPPEQRYKMWYWGHNHGMVSDVGYATSPDGIAWAKHPNNPVLRHGVIPEFAREIIYPSVIKDLSAPPDSLYKMWFVGFPFDTPARYIGHAASPDGVNWGVPAIVLEMDPAESLGFGGLDVVKDGPLFYLYSCYTDKNEQIGYMKCYTSENGRQWSAGSDEPILGPGEPGAWDSRGVDRPAVIHEGATRKMWYGGSDGVTGGFGYAVATIVAEGPRPTTLDEIQGLASDGTHFWVTAREGSTWGLFRVSSADGSILTRYEVPYNTATEEPAAVGYHNGKVYARVHPRGPISSYDVGSGARTTTECSTRIWSGDMAFVGAELWQSNDDAISNRYEIYDQEGHEFPGPVGGRKTIASDGIYLYVADYGEDRRIWRLRVPEGTVVDEYRVTAPSSAGWGRITWHGGKLWSVVHGTSIAPLAVEGAQPEAPASPQTWSADLTASSSSDSGTLTFGSAEGGTDGIDPDLGELELPPLPPSDVFDARFEVAGSNGSARDLRAADLGTATWMMRVQPGEAGYPVRLAWEPASLPQGSFRLQDRVTGGELVHVNMRTQASYELDNPAITSMEIVYGACEVTYDLPRRWSMISRPCQVDDSSLAALFPTALSLFRFDGGYDVATAMVCGEGYWINLPAPLSTTIAGIPCGPVRLDLPARWSMVGPGARTVDVAALQAVTGGNLISVFGFGDGYYVAEVMQPGKGYWVNLAAAGQLDLGGSAAARPVVGVPEGDDGVAWVTDTPADYCEQASDCGAFVFHCTCGYRCYSKDFPARRDCGRVCGRIGPPPPCGCVNNTCQTVSASALPPGAGGWLMHLVIADAAGGSRALTLGRSEGATEAIDGELGERELPPLPPVEMLDARFGVPGTNGSLLDLREAGLDTVSWSVQLQPGERGHPLTFTWDPDSLPACCSFRLQDALGGVLFDQDMRKAGELEIDNPGVTLVNIVVAADRFTAVEDESLASRPADLTLEQNYPNPFNSETVIRYSLPEAGMVTVRVYDIAGQPIRNLVVQHRPAGDYRAVWDGRDQAGRQVANGVYLCVLRTGEFRAVHKMVLMK